MYTRWLSAKSKQVKQVLPLIQTLQQEEPKTILPAVQVLEQQRPNAISQKIAEDPGTQIAAIKPEALKADIPQNDFSGRRARIIKAYQRRFKALILERREMTPQTTLREYAQGLEGKLDRETLVKLTELTRLTEMALYSRQEPDQDLVERAEKLDK